MKGRKGIITLMGTDVTLLGDQVKEGDVAPEFVTVDNDLKEVKFSDFKGKTILIASVPSLDTPVCDMEARHFNEEAGKLGEDIQIIIISMDLPFAQKRWCASAGIENVITLSDYRDASFGMAYGVLIKEVRLLARAIFIVDKKRIIRYVQMIKEVSNEPDYGDALDALIRCT